MKLLIFDFDGTLCDSYETFIQALNKGSSQFGYKAVPAEEIQSVKDKPFIEFMGHLGIQSKQIPALVTYLREELGRKIDSDPVFLGMNEALSSLKERGYSLGILTSNSADNVIRFNKKNQLTHFEFVQSVGISGKEAAIREILNKRSLKTNQAVYIGDETRDVQSSKAAGIAVIAVSWGFNSKVALAKEKPDFMIDAPRELPLLFP